MALAVTSNQSVYVTGYFTGTSDFDPGSGVSNLTSAGGSDVFVLKLDSAGNYVWANRMGGTALGTPTVPSLGGGGGDGGLGIAVGTDGSAYVTGVISSSGDVDPSGSAFSYANAGGYDAFISKVDADGNFVWAKSFGGTWNDYGFAVAVADDGNICISGSYDQSMTIGTFDLSGSCYYACSSIRPAMSFGAGKFFGKGDCDGRRRQHLYGGPGRR